MLNPDARQKLGRLIPLLGTDQQGEMVAAVCAIQRTLKSCGADLHELAAEVAQGPQILVRPAPAAAPPKMEPQTWADLARWCDARRPSLTDREREFVADMVGRLWGDRKPTEKQGSWLRSIYGKLKRAEQ